MSRATASPGFFRSYAERIRVCSVSAMASRWAGLTDVPLPGAHAASVAAAQSATIERADRRGSEWKGTRRSYCRVLANDSDGAGAEYDERPLGDECVCDSDTRGHRVVIRSGQTRAATMDFPLSRCGAPHASRARVGSRLLVFLSRTRCAAKGCVTPEEFPC